MDEEGNHYVACKCDVVVSLVQRSINIFKSASTDQDSPSMDEEDRARKRKSLSNSDEEQNLGDLHVNSSRLRSCSKYFDACLSEKWAGTKTITPNTLVHLTLDVHTDVKYYKDCFSRMSFSKYKDIPNVKHCLKLLQVASQISYLELTEDCVRYLTSIPWSHKDEERIRSFANSAFYPSDCAVDLSARLVLPLSTVERHCLVLDVAVDALCVCFDNIMCNDYTVKDLFSISFRKLISGRDQSSAENVLKHVNDGVKKIIIEDNLEPIHTNLYWILELLLATQSAKVLVEYIVDESPLASMLMELHRCKILEWANPIHSVFKEVIAGRLLLKTSTRYMLYKNWTTILGYDKNEAYKTLGTFIMTFPHETQKKIILEWMANKRGPFDDPHFMKIHAKCLGSLFEKFGLLTQ